MITLNMLVFAAVLVHFWRLLQKAGRCRLTPD
jgi:hypothetical protein